MYRQYNPNPKGLTIDDCAIRALCCLEGMSWEDAAIELFLKAYEMKDVMTSQAVFNAVLRNMGYVRKQIPNTCPDCYTVTDFCNNNPIGRFIVATNSHVVAIIDGDHYDTWDSSLETVVYYWQK